MKTPASTNDAQRGSLRGMVRPFTLGELWAGSNGMRCEHAGCRRRTYTIWLTDTENKQLPEETGPDAATHILQNKLGTALCEKHGPNEMERLPHDHNSSSALWKRAG